MVTSFRDKEAFVILPYEFSIRYRKITLGFNCKLFAIKFLHPTAVYLGKHRQTYRFGLVMSRLHQKL